MKADSFTPLEQEALYNAMTLPNVDKDLEDGLIKDWLNSLPVKIVIADVYGKAKYWNKPWYEYTGLAPDYPKNKIWKAALHPDDIQRTYNAMSYSIRTGKDLQTEYRLKRAADNMYRWHCAKVSPVRDHGNKICRWIAVVNDIHAQKEADYRKDMFLGMASHELKTPLTTLKTLLYLFKKNTPVNDINMEIFECAESQLMRMERLIGNLLDVSKVNAHNMVYLFEEFNFGIMLKECIVHTQQQTENHKIILEQNTNLLITGDKLKLEQVINNLLSNAIKYSPYAQTIIVKSCVVENNIYVSVQDFGIGIAPENLNDIYMPYYRAKNTSTAFQGLGIGLYICSEIIKSHFGKLWARSVPAQGSVFYFSLPINRQFTSENNQNIALT